MPSAAPFWWTLANLEIIDCTSGSIMLKPMKKLITPVTNRALDVAKPISKKAMMKSVIDARNISLGLLCFSPNTAAGPMAARPSSIAGR